MATLSSKQPTNNPVIVNTEDIYKNHPVFAFGPPNAPFNEKLNNGWGKWSMLFAADQDGDATFVNLYKWMLKNAKTQTDRDRIVEGMQRILQTFRQVPYELPTENENSDEDTTMAEVKELYDAIPKSTPKARNIDMQI